MEIKINSVKFEVEYKMDKCGGIDELWIFIGDQEVTEVLSEKVLKEIDEYIYEHHEEDDPRYEPEHWEDR